jgi:hypothetical protein
MSEHKYDISVLISGIRTHNWAEVYTSLCQACTRYSFELVFVGPFDPPSFLKHFDNVKYIKDYGQPSRCSQRGLLECEGHLVFQTVDDCNFVKYSLDYALAFYEKQCTRKDIINGRYFEGGNQMPLEYWKAWHHESLRLEGIHQDWNISLQPIIDTEYAREIGGYDCRYEYCNAGIHDFVFRVQKDGGKVYNSLTEICNADHMPGYSGDHEPIERLWLENDFPLLKKMYGSKKSNRRIKIDINNWSKTPAVWERRFDPNNLPIKYTDLYPDVAVEVAWKRRQL